MNSRCMMGQDDIGLHRKRDVLYVKRDYIMQSSDWMDHPPELSQAKIDFYVNCGVINIMLDTKYRELEILMDEIEVLEYIQENPGVLDEYHELVNG
jgi:hypothetical protein